MGPQAELKFVSEIRIRSTKAKPGDSFLPAQLKPKP